MASGDTLFVFLPHGSVPTESAYATLDTIDDGSTIAGFIPCLDFAGATADEHVEWTAIVPSHYDGGGFDVIVEYSMSGTDGSDVQFEIRAWSVPAATTMTSENLQSRTATDITDTPSGTANVSALTPAGAITHSNANTPSSGERVRFRLSRDYDHAANADDAQVTAVYVTET